MEDWFDNDTEMEAYQDLHFIKKYCEHISIPFEHYQTLLHGEPSTELLACELFQDYKKDFDQSNDIKKLASQTFFKNYNPEHKHAELKKRFLSYLQKIEKDKLFYFVVCFSNPQKVLINKSPSDNKEQKLFLGYEWSAAKGNEGIKLTTDAHSKHLTPLYDPGNRYNPDKINTLIHENFIGNAVAIPESLQHYASLVSLVDLLDFSRKDFDKHISLTIKKTVSSIESKWDLVRLGDICSFEYGKPLPEDKRTNGNYPVMGSNGRVGFHNECLIKGPSIIVGRKGSAGKVIWENTDCFPIDTTFYVTLKNNNVLLSYLFLALKTALVHKSAKYGIV